LDKCTTFCAVPLPNDAEPITIARPLSCKAAATNSDDDADNPSIRMTSGIVSYMLPSGLARNTCVSDGLRASSTTINP
jgi:hypothetical protein